MTKVFTSYSHKDEYYREELEKHLSLLKHKGLIDTWTDKKLVPGDEWRDKLSSEVATANIILLLVSADFLASEYCYDVEMKTAIERHYERKAIVIPIIIRPCDWQDAPFAVCQALPSNGRSIKEWMDTDDAYLNIVLGLKRVLYSIQSNNIIDFQSTQINDELKGIKERLLSAETLKDLNRLLEDIDSLKSDKPNKEVIELKNIIKTRIDFEIRKEYDMRKSRSLLTMNKKYESERRSRKNDRQLLIGVLAIVVLIILSLLFMIFSNK